MVTASQSSLGILALESGRSQEQNAVASPLPGALRNPDTFEFPIITETVHGAWVENVVRGDPALEAPYVEAALRLVEQGAKVITSNCGYSYRHQQAVAAAVSVPVIMSSLIFLPSILLQLPRQKAVLVLTYDANYCGNDLVDLTNKIYADRIIIAGIEGGRFWTDERQNPVPPIDINALYEDVYDRVAIAQQEHLDIGAILCECAAFPLVTARIREDTNLPVYDIVGLCNATMASLAQHPAVGSR